MASAPPRTLDVHTDKGTVRCKVVSIERTAQVGVWLIEVNPDSWLDSGAYPDCIMRRGDRRTHGAFSLFDYRVGPGNTYIHAVGTFRPAPATPQPAET